MASFDLEHRLNLRLAQLGKTKTQETKDKISASMLKAFANPEIKAKLQKPKSNETKARMSQAALNRPALTCPHCGKQGTSNVMYKWHFDNCKKAVDNNK